MTTRQGQLSALALKSADLFLLLLALMITEIFNHSTLSVNGIFDYTIDFLSSRIKLSNALLGGLLLIVWHFIFNFQGLYRSHRLRSFGEELKQILGAVLLVCVALLVAGKLGNWQTINLRSSFIFLFGAIFLCGGFRLILRIVLRRLRRRGRYLKTLLIVGGGTRAVEFARIVRRRKDLGYRLLGFVDNERSYSRGWEPDVPWLGEISKLPSIINREVIDDVAIALPIKSHYVEIQQVIALLGEQGIAVQLLSDFFPQQITYCQPIEFEGEPLLFFHSAPPWDWQMEMKRIVDLIGALVLLTLSAPLLVFVAILIKLDSKGPVFFTQERMGYNKHRFRMLKFRTMVADAEAKIKEIEHLNEKEGPIFKIKNDPRITRIGRFLRKSSIDELPQLINVLLGDMSLVGPRPLSIRDALGLEESWQKRRFSVRPGLTCLWQISGRSNLSFEQWMKLDLEYIDHWSLFLDWKILLRTIPAVLLSRGAV